MSDHAEKLRKLAKSERITGHDYDTLMGAADEIDRLEAYADKLADGLPDGMLPKDVELLRHSNEAMASQIEELEAKIDSFGVKHPQADVWGIQVWAHTGDWIATQVHKDGLFQQPRDDVMVEVRGHTREGGEVEQFTTGRASEFVWGAYDDNKDFHITHFRIIEDGEG